MSRIRKPDIRAHLWLRSPRTNLHLPVFLFLSDSGEIEPLSQAFEDMTPESRRGCSRHTHTHTPHTHTHHTPHTTHHTHTHMPMLLIHNMMTFAFTCSPLLNQVLDVVVHTPPICANSRKVRLSRSKACFSRLLSAPRLKV